MYCFKLRCFLGEGILSLGLMFCFFSFWLGGDSEFEGLMFGCFNCILAEYLFLGGDSEFGLDFCSFVGVEGLTIVLL